MNQVIFRCQFGSHIYGTNLPTSDRDFKGVFVPDAEALVLQRAAKHIETGTKTDPTKKNSADDVDDESFSVSEYLRLLMEGQTVALDMLFTPKSFVLHYGPDWELILKYKDRLLHKGTSAFVGYTRAQAAKYGVKGFRVAAVKQMLEFFTGLPDYEKLSVFETTIREFVAASKNEHVSMVMIQGAQDRIEPAIDVCGRKIPLHAKVGYAADVMQRIYDNYGARAKMAEENQGVDWKALMHAVRVAHEAEELLLTGNITFPRPERDLLLKIRTGSMPYKEIELIIEEGLIRVEAAQAKSTLPDKPDHDFATKLLYEIHREVIYNHLVSYNV